MKCVHDGILEGRRCQYLGGHEVDRDKVFVGNLPSVQPAQICPESPRRSDCSRWKGNAGEELDWAKSNLALR